MAISLGNSSEFIETRYEFPQKFSAFSFEEHDNLFWRKLTWYHPEVPYLACVIYLCTIFGLQRFMKNRSPLKLQKPLVLWNLFLAVFSFVGLVRITPEFLSNWDKPNGFYRSLCTREGRNRPLEFWGLLFMLSKFMELGDTVFIVLKKQPLLPLQWYHHCMVTVFSWTLYPWNEQILAWYAFMNYGVHQFMYLYFALRGLNYKVPEVIAKGITSLQTLQMVVGLVINLYTVYIIGIGQPCDRHPISIVFSLGIYLSLWILFAKFFVQRYYSQKQKYTKKVE